MKTLHFASCVTSYRAIQSYQDSFLLSGAGPHYMSHTISVQVMTDKTGCLSSVDGRPPIEVRDNNGYLLSIAWARSGPIWSVEDEDDFTLNLNSAYLNRREGPAEITYDAVGQIVDQTWQYNGHRLFAFQEVCDNNLLAYLKDKSPEYRYAALEVYRAVHPESKVAKVLLAAEKLL